MAAISERQRQLMASKLMREPVSKFEAIELPVRNIIPKNMTRAFRNNRYVVMVFDNTPTTKGYAIRVMVQAHNAMPIHNHWREMQKIKNELFGEQVTAIEYYPAERDLIDEHNIYWMWIFPDGVLPLILPY